jgi:hypothetical protein
VPELALLFVSLMGDPWIASISWLVINPQTSIWAWFESPLIPGTGFGVSRLLHPGEITSREQNKKTKTFRRIGIVFPRCS